MKRKTFYNISLSLPYIALIASGAFMLSVFVAGLGEVVSSGSQDGFLTILLGILVGSVAFYAVGGFIWVPLYTWMVVVMLFWGRGKTTNEVRNLYLLSPILLGCSMGFPAVLMDFPGAMILLFWGLLRIANLDSIVSRFFENGTLELGLTVGVLWAFMAAICVAVGYGFVGIVLLIERVMTRRGLFKDE